MLNLCNVFLIPKRLMELTFYAMHVLANFQSFDHQCVELQALLPLGNHIGYRPISICIKISI